MSPALKIKAIPKCHMLSLHMPLKVRQFYSHYNLTIKRPQNIFIHLKLKQHYIFGMQLSMSDSSASPDFKSFELNNVLV